MIIEGINADDIEELTSFALKSFQESYYKNYVPNIEYLKNLFTRCLGTDEYFGIKCSKDGKIIGIFVGRVSNMGFCDMKIGMDDGFYVLPKYRGSEAAKLMFEAFFEWCNKKMVKPGMLIHYGDNNELVYGLCEKMGMIERGRLFIGA